jgi:hypothetical protein
MGVPTLISYVHEYTQTGHSFYCILPTNEVLLLQQTLVLTCDDQNKAEGVIQKHDNQNKAEGVIQKHDKN